MDVSWFWEDCHFHIKSAELFHSSADYAAEDPFLQDSAKIKKFRLISSGGEMGIRTPGTAVAVHMISNHAPSASSDISPYLIFWRLIII